jgi:hypothetical protein
LEVLELALEVVLLLGGDVPASLPFTPAAARVSSAAIVSSKLRPAAFAAAPPCVNAIAKSLTSAVVVFAAVAIASATCVASLALRPKRLIAFAVVDAASARSISPAAARPSAAFSPPPRIWLTVRPPLASSVCAWAACSALNFVAAPASIACLCSCCIWRPDASATDFRLESCASKLAASLTLL